MFIHDRPSWKLGCSEYPIPIREGMHLRHGTFRFYRVLRVNFRAKMVELLPMFDAMNLTVVENEAPVEVSFEDIERDYKPTLLGDSLAAAKPLSRWERLQSGNPLPDP